MEGNTGALKPVHGTITSLADDSLNLAKWDPAIAIPRPSELMKLSKSTISELVPDSRIPSVLQHSSRFWRGRHAIQPKRS